MNVTTERTGIRAWRRRAALYCCALASAGLVAATPLRAEPDLGTWLNSEQSGKIVLRECDEQSLCGELVWLKDAADENGRPWRDENNRDVSLRSRPVVGINVLIDVKKIAPMTWQGYIYDPEVGKIYYLKHLKIGRDKVEIKGCLKSGWPCRTKYWTRTEPLLPPAPPIAIATVRPAPKLVPERKIAMAAPVARPAPAYAPVPPGKLQLRGPVGPAPVARPSSPETTAALPYPVANPRPGGYLVQVAARQSHHEAVRAFDELQLRYPKLLGGMVPEILRADLGAQGIWYRVGVGPMQRHSAAANFCQRLKLRGADCLIRQR